MAASAYQTSYGTSPAPRKENSIGSRLRSVQETFNAKFTTQSHHSGGSDMGTEYLRSVHGIITAIQVILASGALFASSFIWDHTNVYIQLGYRGYGWQTLIIAILLFSWFTSIVILLMQITGRDLIGQLGKFKLLILYGICCALCIVSAALETWYSKISKGNGLYNPRFIIVTVLNWILVVLYFVLILVTIFFS